MKRLEFRPTLGFTILSAASPILLLGLGSWGWIQSGQLRVLPVILLILGIVLAAVAVFDVPIKIIVDEAGVVRRCALRRQVFPWDDIVAFRRSQPRRGRRGVSHTAGGPRPSAKAEPVATPSKGGLLLETRARRRYMLSLGQELPATYGALEEAVRRYAPGLSLPGPPYYAKADIGL